MTEGTFEEGYRAGWESVAGAAPLPSEPTQPPEGILRDYQHGFEYGRADVLEEFQPGRAGGPAWPLPELKLVSKPQEPSDPAGKLATWAEAAATRLMGAGES